MRFKTSRLEPEVLNPHKDQLLIFYTLHKHPLMDGRSVVNWSDCFIDEMRGQTTPLLHYTSLSSFNVFRNNNIF